MEYGDRPLVQALVKFREANSVSFHVPGHKHGLLSGLPLALRGALQYDFTELEGLDDLHEPVGVIEEAQRLLATVYSSEQSYFLVNGSTVGNLAMIYATCRPGETILVQRNAHKSVFHAIELTGAKPVYVSPDWDCVTKTAGVVTVEKMRRALKSYPEAKVVILTYPTYYGKTGTEMETIIRLCHDHNIPVLVDEAHGAHFVVGYPFPRSALDMGADIVVHSAHKTLPAMTMASFLHVKSDLVSHERIAHYLQMLQSSSPSYLGMASLDDARSYAATYTEEDKEMFMARRLTFIKRLAMISRLQVVENDDPLKLLLRLEGYSGFELQTSLEAQGIYSELADPFQVVFVLPLLKAKLDYPFEEIGKRIQSAVAGIGDSYHSDAITESLLFNEDISCPALSFAEVAQMESEWLSFEESVGRVVAGSIIPYPPGIPLLISGEKVTEGHIRYLDELLRMGAKLQGAIRVKEKQLVVVKEGMEE